MNICVTGGAGMIGSNLVKKLISSQHQVKVIDNLWRGRLENLEFEGIELINLNKDFFKIDLSDPSNVNVVINILQDVDIVIHLADIVAGIGYVFNKQYEIFKLNNSINTNLFKAVNNSTVKKLIYVGTACSFPLELQSSLEAELKEEQLFPAHPESAYGWSKLIGQLELRYLSEVSGIDISTLMLHNVYGPNCEYEGERTQVIPSLINRVINANDGDRVSVWGSGQQGRAFVYVDDVVEALYKASFQPNLPEFMQIGPNYCSSIKEIASKLVEISGKNIELFFDRSKPEGDKGRYADYSLALKNLGWSPNVHLEEGLAITYQWIKEQKELQG